MDYPLKQRPLSSKASYYQRLFSGLILITMLSGCAFVPASPPATHTYLLTPNLPHSTAPSSSGLTLMVSAPRTVPGYDTRRMAYTQKPYELDYFGLNKWIAPPAQMLQPILVRALEASGRFQSVISGNVRTLADLKLDTQILRLVQDFSVQPSRGHIILQVRLIDLSNGQETASRIFEARKPAPEEGPYGGVVALNQGLAQILRELVAFIAQADLAP